MTLVQAILSFVLFQRLAELWLSRSNTRRLMAMGGIEHGAAHYPWLVVLHAGWLVALVLGVPADAEIDGFWLTIFVILQAARFWVLMTLGEAWTTRIITVPGRPLVRSGPYRYLRHPNYAVVAGEIAVLPLVFEQWLIAIAFSLANAVLLYERIRVEDATLAERRSITSAGS
ncbi:MAG TPA: isoprenylcysteine carboxylmethyltransferase family protein [Alphaproteobacteria bacterium]|nr:isoprenylcysteine carboxylmethyltransferase family protein [Alphaproteobacteria bacterium]